MKFKICFVIFYFETEVQPKTFPHSLLPHIYHGRLRVLISTQELILLLVVFVRLRLLFFFCRGSRDLSDKGDRKLHKSVLVEKSVKLPEL